MKKKVSYILYNERPTSGIIEKQVLELLIEISKNKNIDITLICIWNPIIFFLNLNKIKTIIKRLKNYSIKIENYPIALFPNRFFFRKISLLKISIFFNYIFFYLLKLKRFDLVHSRSYFPSYISVLLNKRNLYETVFDMRSLLPEESINLNFWQKSDSIFKFWKKIEQHTVEKSSYTVTVSENMKDYVNSTYPNKNIINIHLIGSLENVIFDQIKRNEIRKNLNLDDKNIFLYVGSLDEDTNNNIKNYAQFLNDITSLDERAFFIFVTPKIMNFHYSYLGKNNTKKNYLLIEGLNPDIFMAADYGISILNLTHDSDTRFGIKVAEYLSYGLPIIIRNVGGAEKVVKSIDAGFIIDSDQSNMNLIKNFLERSFDREIIINKSEKLFSLKNIANQYLDIYFQKENN